MWGFIDWGTKEHQLCVVDDAGELICQRRFSQTADGLARLCAVLRQPKPGCLAVKGVGIERSDGPVVDTLLEGGFAVFAINPLQIDRFRKFVAPSGRKDDRLDAHVGAEALRTHREQFDKLLQPDPRTIMLRDLVRLRHDLVQQKVRLQHRVREQLNRYYPQFSELGDLEPRWQRVLWQIVPSPEKARRVRPQTVAKLLRKYRVRRFDAEGLLSVLRQPPLPVAAGVVHGACGRIPSYFAELELLHLQLEQTELALEETLQQLDDDERKALVPGKPTDVQLLRQMPGFGTVVVAALYAYAPEALAARDWQGLRTRAGVAPVSSLSGKQQNRFHDRKKRTVRMRHACTKQLRHAMHHAARNATLCSPFYKARYQRYRGAGHSHGRAYRQIGDHLLRVLVSTLRSRKPFDSGQLNQENA